LIVGLVPARGGSKGIPGKNLARVAGKPLLAWTLEAAAASARLDRLVVSTDDAGIAGEARLRGAEVLARPAALAADDTSMRDVVLHAVEALGRPDVVVLLQPTSPLRTARHIDEAVGLLEVSGADCVVSVVAVPHRFVPSSLMELVDGVLIPVGEAPWPRRQEKPKLYARNGPAVLVLRTRGLAERAGLYNGDCRAYVMDEEASLDVDTAFELRLSDLLLGG